MDTSEQYINMCRKAKELQEIWEPKEGDYFTLNHFLGRPAEVYCFGDFVLPYCNTVSTINPKLHEMMPIRDFLDADSVWLPRTDQYCNIGSMGWAALAEKCIKLYPLKEHGLYLYPTFERAAIAVIMKSMFRKKWNGEDWI